MKFELGLIEIIDNKPQILNLEDGRDELPYDELTLYGGEYFAIFVDYEEVGYEDFDVEGYYGLIKLGDIYCQLQTFSEHYDFRYEVERLIELGAKFKYPEHNKHL